MLSVDGRRAGILRYQLFWDNTPFCTMLYLDEKHRNLGYGTLLMNFWESEMRTQGFNLLLVSTRSDEGAQHFFHKLGYTDSGCLLTPDQPTELFLSKRMKAV